MTPRDVLPRLERTRNLAPVDDVPVWAVSCFFMRKGYRRKGVSAALIAGALALARRAKAPALEAYPLDADQTTSSSFTGYATTFARAGFKTIACRVPARPIMRYDLTRVPKPKTRSR